MKPRRVRPLPHTITKNYFALLNDASGPRAGLPGLVFVRFCLLVTRAELSLGGPKISVLSFDLVSADSANHKVPMNRP